MLIPAGRAESAHANARELSPKSQPNLVRRPNMTEELWDDYRILEGDLHADLPPV
jgi:hypothetical protein